MGQLGFPKGRGGLEAMPPSSSLHMRYRGVGPRGAGGRLGGGESELGPANGFSPHHPDTEQEELRQLHTQSVQSEVRIYVQYTVYNISVCL